MPSSIVTRWFNNMLENIIINTIGYTYDKSVIMRSMVKNTVEWDNLI